MPGSPRRDARPLRCAPIALALAVVALTGCGAGSISVPSVPSVPDLLAAGGGSASFDINGVRFQVAQSGTIQADFPESKDLTYSGPLGCKGHYFTGDYTEHIKVYFHYYAKSAYMLIDNSAPATVYRFGPPHRQGTKLVFSGPTPGDHQATVSVDCPAGT